MPRTTRKPASRRARWPHEPHYRAAGPKWESLSKAIRLACGPRGFTTIAELAKAADVSPRVLLAFAAGEVRSPAWLPFNVANAFDPANGFVPRARVTEFELAARAVSAEYFYRADRMKSLEDRLALDNASYEERLSEEPLPE